MTRLLNLKEKLTRFCGGLGKRLPKSSETDMQSYETANENYELKNKIARLENEVQFLKDEIALIHGG